MRPPRSLNRRSALSLAAAVGFLSLVAPTLPASAAAVHPSMAPAAPLSLRTVAPGAGIKKLHKDVFQSSSFLDMLLIPGPKGRVKVVTATTGNTNQFQVFDAVTGKLEFAATTPGKINSNLVWDAAGQTVYAGAGGGLLIAWSIKTSKLVSLGQVAPSATAVYGFDFDADGRLWGGSYPGGIIWNYDPRTKAFASLPALDSTTDYVQALGIWGDTVFVGTGSQSPHLVCFKVSAPGKRTVIDLPDAGITGFVHRIVVRGDKLFVFAEDSANIARCYVYDPVEGAWANNTSVKSASKAFAAEAGKDTWHVVGGSLTKTDTATMGKTALCATNIPVSRSVLVSGDRIYVAGNQDGHPVVAEYSIGQKKELRRVRPGVRLGSLGVQSLIASDHGLLYLGGYQGDGLASLNPDTGARWQSSSNVGISQIEHLMQYDKNRLYIGSYGSAKLYSFDRNRISEGDAAFTHITTLRKPYMQSRPFAWAKAGGKVLAGTVPEYGLRGGALATIDPGKNALGLVMNKFIPEQSIVGLSGYGDIAYGTTSGRAGYGASDYTGDAAVFAYNPETEKTLWVSYLKGHRDLYSPVLIDGTLYVATINGLLALDPSNGKLRETLEVRQRTARPGYQSARALRIPGTSRIVHSSGGVVLLIDVVARTQSVLAKNDFGAQIAVTPDGRVFVAHQGSHVAELHTDAQPTISSLADLVTINAEGEMLVARSNGAAGFGTAAVVGRGWKPKTMLSFHVTDWNADGIPDVLVQRTGGALELYRGKTGGGFEAAQKVSENWSKMNITVGPWVKGSLYPTVVGVNPAGEVRCHLVDAKGRLDRGTLLGTGWKGRQVAMLDMKETGAQGLLGWSAGRIYFRQSNGKGRLLGNDEKVTSSGWSDTVGLASVSAHYRKRSGLLSVRRDGSVRYVSADGTRFSGIRTYPMDLKSSLMAGSRRFGAAKN